MLSSVVTSSVSPVAIAGTFIMLGVVILLGQQVQKELTGARSAVQKVQIWGQVLVIGMVPVLLAFLLVVITSMTGLGW